MAGTTPSLRQVRAAQLRARAARAALGKIALGTTFLVGALAFARAPDRHQDESILWMTALLFLSTIYVALGFRTLARVWRVRPATWVAMAGAWGVLGTVVLAFLLRG